MRWKFEFTNEFWCNDGVNGPSGGGEVLTLTFKYSPSHYYCFYLKFGHKNAQMCLTTHKSFQHNVRNDEHKEERNIWICVLAPNMDIVPQGHDFSCGSQSTPNITPSIQDFQKENLLNICNATP